MAFTTTPNINLANVASVTASGTGENSDSISVVITDMASHTTTAVTTTVSGGSWSVNGINASSLNDGTVTYAVTETDLVGNPTIATQTETKIATAPTVVVAAVVAWVAVSVITTEMESPLSPVPLAVSLVTLVAR